MKFRKLILGAFAIALLGAMAVPANAATRHHHRHHHHRAQ